MSNKPRYNPKIHNRRSIRLKGYDYSQKGLYFVTMVVKSRACLFGEIVNRQMILNEAGSMINKWYNELGNKYPDIRCLEHIVMPNHFHCIIENTGANVYKEKGAQEGGYVGPPQLGPPQQPCPIPDEPILGEHKGSPLWRVIQWFKTMSTNEYIRNVKNNDWPRFDGKLWQRNYYEHIIRDERSNLAIAAYITNTPSLWDNDSINPGNKKK